MSFAHLSPEQRKEVARKGALKLWKLKKAHKWTPKEAARAGRLGGLAKARNKLKLKEIKDETPQAENP